MSRPCCFATASIRARGPTRIGARMPMSAASTAPLSDVSSHGCATAVRAGGRPLQSASRRSYFSCLRVILEFAPSIRSLEKAACLGLGGSWRAPAAGTALPAVREPGHGAVEHDADALQHRQLLVRR